MTPRVRVEQLCAQLGRDEVLRRCAVLVDGGDVDPEFVAAMGGEPGKRVLPEGQRYWLRVWGARGLLWAGVDDTVIVRTALKDEHWRVREMACKVVARHRLGDLLDDVAKLRSDRVARVRQAAARAVMRVVEQGE